MELHTLGVNGGYTQQDVTEVARVFTGWTLQDPRDGGGFVFKPRLHEPGAKTVLGHKIKESGENEGMEVLDILAHSSRDREIHLDRSWLQRFRLRQSAAIADRRDEQDVPEDRRRLARSHAHDVPLAGILGARGLQREGENAAGVRGLVAACHRGGHY